MEVVNKYIQSFYKCAGSECCYTSCLIDIAKEYHRKKGTDYKKYFFNEQDAIEKGIYSGFISFNFNDYEDFVKSFYVTHSCDFLYILTGQKWSMKKTNYTYMPVPGEYAIEFYALNQKNADMGKGHFIRSQTKFNSLQNSKTVQNGKVYQKRIFTEVA